MSKDLAVIEKAVKALATNFIRDCTNKEEVAFGRESQFALQAVRATPMLQKCDIVSLQEAVMQVAYVGLTLNPLLGYCYLVPFKNENSGALNAKLMIGYKGMIKLGTDEASVRAVEAEVIYERDEFFIEHGTVPRIIHRIKAFNTKERGEPIGAYCITTLASGQKTFEIMDRDQIMKCKAVAKTKNVWEGPFGMEQWKKTVVRRAWKRWPRTTKLEHAEQVMHTVEPAQFNEPSAEQKAEAASTEPVVCVSDTQTTELHAMLTDKGFSGEAASKWLAKLAKSFGYDSINALPAKDFEAAKAKLNAGIAEHAAKHQVQKTLDA